MDISYYLYESRYNIRVGLILTILQTRGIYYIRIYIILLPQHIIRVEALYLLLYIFFYNII